MATNYLPYIMPVDRSRAKNWQYPCIHTITITIMMMIRALLRWKGEKHVKHEICMHEKWWANPMERRENDKWIVIRIGYYPHRSSPLDRREATSDYISKWLNRNYLFIVWHTHHSRYLFFFRFITMGVRLAHAHLCNTKYLVLCPVEMPGANIDKLHKISN